VSFDLLKEVASFNANEDPADEDAYKTQHSDYVKLKADNDGLTKALNDAYSSNDDTTAATLKTFNTAFKDLPKVGENNKAALSALSAIRKTMGLYPAELDL